MKLKFLKRKYLFVMVLVIIFVSIFLFTEGCKYLPIPNTFSIYEEDDIELIVEKVEEGVLYYTLINNTTEEISYGIDVFIQKKGVLVWKTLPSNVCYILIEKRTQPGTKETSKVFLKEIYGELSKGRYRIVKPLKISNNDIYISGEFTIK